jgi:multidrug efflux pump subunit AcrA (membrane-fusion protein)
MLARVRIVTRPGNALVVPQEALIFDTDSYFAYVIRGQNVFERRRVGIASWKEQGYVRVLKGLDAGDRVVAGESIQVNELWHLASGTS